MLAWSFAHLGGSVGVMAALAESARQRVEERQLGQVDQNESMNPYIDWYWEY